jgi:hypothetical protein
VCGRAGSGRAGSALAPLLGPAREGGLVISFTPRELQNKTPREGLRLPGGLVIPFTPRELQNKTPGESAT